jgi:aspartate aminotransferase
LPIDGDPGFVACALAFAYGANSAPLLEHRVAGAQTLSGTGACRVGGAFFAKCLGAGTAIYVSDPTWGNHIAIMQVSRFPF